MPNTENADCQSLKKKRSSIKAKLTSFEKYLQKSEDLLTISESAERSKLIELEQRIQGVEALMTFYDDIQNEIEYSSDNAEQEYSEREEFEDRLHSVLAKAKYILEKCNPRTNDTKTESHISSASNSNLEGVKLPDINLPKFDGSYEAWMDFRDIFSSLIQDSSHLNDIQKYHYLRASLVGSATQVIQSIEFSAANYKIAWDTLCERFNNKSILIQNHIKSIFNTEQVTAESAAQIRNLSDKLFKHLSSLKQLGEPVEHWDTIIIYIVSNKLDKNTAREWERLRAKQSSCTLEYFRKFLKERANLLESIELNTDYTSKNSQRIRDARGTSQGNRDFKTRGLNANIQEDNSALSEKKKYLCFMCKKEHSLFYCPEFLSLSVKDRNLKVKSLHLCTNCLRRNHSPQECKWSGCKLCGEKHNTILHGLKKNTTAALALNQDTEKSDTIRDSDSNTSQEDLTTTAYNSATAQNALLSTALVKIRNATGQFITVRSLLDCGSQSSFLTSNLCDKLKLPKTKVNLTISGINEKMTQSNYKCSINVRSTSNSYNFNLSCFVLDNITSELPGIRINRQNLNIPSNVQLADPRFEISQPTDLLIGANMFWELIIDGKINLGPRAPILQNTRLGWIVAGPFGVSTDQTICNFSKNDALQDQLTNFWEVEEISSKKPLSNEEALCEQHFKENLRLSPTGRYVVAVPLKDSPNKLGESREIAIKRLLSLERKLYANPDLRILYIEFLKEYEMLGHMTEIPNYNHLNTKRPEYYLPHHGVLRESSLTTKLRVVFNASSPSSTGVSLNDLQMNGPIIQPDLMSIILRFRTRSIVLSSDIKMMYRQILIAPEQRNLQKIVWRVDATEPIKTFQLNTVTYGTIAASFLAIRCLHEVANECENEHPKIAKIINNDMYVDDLLTSTDSLDDARYIKKELSRCLEKRGFELRKWKSNHPEVIGELETEQAETMIEFSNNKDQDTKILGLMWSSDRDILTYKISPIKETSHKQITKRTILSRIATIFDPLGLVSPCIIIAKILLQKLWAEKLTWDQPLPSHILTSWIDFSSELEYLNNVNIDRKVTCDRPTSISLHGFSDASESSYGACVYIVSCNQDGITESNLICAKSKVAPLKSITIPRLELCAALILSQLLDKVLDSIDLPIDQVYCWTDSTIVLGWLRTSPNLLKTFVNHRVAQIQRLTKPFKWMHVPTKENPADLVSRGVRPIVIINSEFWWHGPKWLILAETMWPSSPIHDCELPELRNVSLLATDAPAKFPFERFSCLNKLKRSLAFMLRFIHNSRIPSQNRISSCLTASEIQRSFEILIKICHQESFPVDHASLASKNALPSNSKLLSLHPFLDDKGLIRVGGRLSNSSYSFNKKHPILLPSHHHLTNLIVTFEHIQLMHAGPQSLLSNIRERFWPISGRNLARKIVRNCVKCSRYSAQNVQPIMGDLPEARVHPSMPFSKVGVDYAGPFLMKDKRGRGCKMIKCWIAVFVCFSTRAIHLELILSLSSDDFLQAFHRFVSRRGKPSEVFSDNGTNFVKANKDLLAMGIFLQENSVSISNSINNIGIKWHFIPSNSPHFGGIWEAGVKSLKYHLKRVLGSYKLFFFDFQTLLVRIEAILNSRPLTPISSNPEDLSVLSPAHFLIGRNLTVIADPLVDHLTENRLSQFQLVQKVYEQFWNRWSKEYIADLQQRRKWTKNKGSISLGQVVLIKDSNLPPMKWRLGRILNLIPGKDGVCRVAIVKTADGILSRAVVKLVPLPVET